jgi:hypothetical protein
MMQSLNVELYAVIRGYKAVIILCSKPDDIAADIKDAIMYTPTFYTVWKEQEVVVRLLVKGTLLS